MKITEAGFEVIPFCCNVNVCNADYERECISWQIQWEL